ncbi:MAG: M24 family metallopeptidase [Deltaproteobacteria bacterium]|nr:M24 family metallopeptidase [Deltaproteobacteria bacterium]
MPKSESPIAGRLEAVRKQMAKMSVDVMIVRSTDRFLNEYVPTDESARVWVSGFTGSMGEVVLTKDRAYLAVDGRYWLQAEQETSPDLFEVVKVPMGRGLDQAVAELLTGLAAKAKNGKLRIGFEPDRVTPSTLELFQSSTPTACTWKPLFPSPVEVARGAARPAPREPGIRLVDERRVGATVEEKLRTLQSALAASGLDALLVQRLDDIAYLSNLRGDELSYQSTFKAIALATGDRLFIALDPAKVPQAVRAARDAILFMPEAELWTLIGKKSKRRNIGYDRRGNTEQGRMAIEATGATAVAITSPVGAMKAVKNDAELKVMREAFGRADRVVHGAITWLCQKVAAKERVTEYDFAEHVEQSFRASGATGLSFKVISAAGKNGAIIHYSDPSRRRVIREGELMLLDTGAYYDEGYATDLTRTFLVGGRSTKATAEQKRYYTLVLKGAIGGMSAIVPAGASGVALDALVRAPLWAAGLDYAHGTGHGVGINVHEFPPRVAPAGASTLQAGYVFSIEPGVYVPSFGGIRIENLCTLEPTAKDGAFLKVVPLTFCPLDRRLIDAKLLTAEEKRWLLAYAKGFKTRNA